MAADHIVRMLPHEPPRARYHGLTIRREEWGDLLEAGSFSTGGRETSFEAVHPWSVERTCLRASLAVAALTMYGSLVPFDLRSPDFPSPGAWLGQLRFTPVSLTDILVNAGVGVPLGFFLMAAVRGSGQQSWVRGAAAVLAIGCASAVLATGAELVQVLSPTRKDAWNDVVAQSLGAMVGALAWLAAGRAVVQWVRQLASQREIPAFAAGLLQLYVPAYVILQLTPATSPFHLVHSVMAQCLLSIPIGVLAGLGWNGKRPRPSFSRAAVLSLSAVIAVCIAQYIVWWRHTGVAEVLGGSIGALLGTAAAMVATRAQNRHPTTQSDAFRPWFLLAAAAWTALLLGGAWTPAGLDLGPDMEMKRLIQVSLVPFASYQSYAASPLRAVHEAMLSFLLAVPLGLLLRSAWRAADEPRVCRGQNIATWCVALTALLMVEFGQTLLLIALPELLLAGLPDLTNVLIGGPGALTGIAIGTELQRRSRGQSLPRIVPAGGRQNAD